jgi:hypothetical protein
MRQIEEEEEKRKKERVIIISSSFLCLLLSQFSPIFIICCFFRHRQMVPPSEDDIVPVEDVTDDGFSAVSCSICLDSVGEDGGTSMAKLQCGHEFHLGDLNF